MTMDSLVRFKSVMVGPVVLVTWSDVEQEHGHQYQ